MGKRGPKSAASRAAKVLIPIDVSVSPWDEPGMSRAERVIAFCNALPITSGTRAGSLMKLRPWQVEIISAIYRTDAQGRRPVRTALISLPRKNGKTQLAAMLALAHLLGPESEPRGQVYSAASDREQAALIYREMEAILLSVQVFAARTHIQSFRKTITDLKTGSVFCAMTADARKAHGLSPSFMVCDELAQWANRDLYDNLSTGTGARNEPLMVVISTQSADPRHIMSELVDYSQKIDEGTLPTDPAFYGKVYCAPDDADPWDEQVWFDCNPALDDFRSLDEMRAFAEQARKIPAKESVFRNLYLNQRVDAEARWISSAAYDDCVSPLPDLTGRDCYGGLDLSSTQDLSALSLCFPPLKSDEPFYIMAFSWCPKEAIKKRAKNDRVPYDLWSRDGWLFPTPGAVVDYAFIIRKITDLKKTYNLKAILFDRWGVTQIQKQLEDQGVPVIAMGQGFQSMSPPSREMEKLIISRRIQFDDNPVLRWNFSNVIAEIDPAGNIKPSKKKSRAKIDLAVSSIMSLDGALRNQIQVIRPTITWI